MTWDTVTSPNPAPVYPPSFSESQSDANPHRLRTRQRTKGGLKLTTSPSRFLILSNDFEFAGWGSVFYVEFSDEDLRKGEEVVKQDREGPVFGPWMASAVAANEVFGSVFYAFPPVVAAAGV